jgi:hypothetical protein
MDKRAAGQYLDNLFGRRAGHVAVAYKDKGESWQEHTFAWPKGRVSLLKWAEIHQDANVFICPALRKNPNRVKGDGTALDWLWADVDMDKVPTIKRADVEARIKALGTLTVASGSGDNRHVYVKLERQVTIEEHRKLNTGLRDYLYADAKHADNSLLRLPGTTNWKTDAGSAVAIVGEATDKRSVDTLMQIPAFRKARVTSLDGTGDWTPVEMDGLPRRVKAMASMPVDEAVAKYGSRYKAVWAITGELYKRGLTPDMVHTLMDQFPAAVQKNEDEHAGYDVHKDVSRRIDRDNQAIPAEVEEDEDDPFPEADDEDESDQKQRDFNDSVEKELQRRGIRRAADMAEAMAGHTQPPDDTSESLDDALSMPAEPIQYLIDGLCSATGTVVITGQYKSGKTHLMTSSLIRSLADNEPFLGARHVHVPEEGAIVGHWNLEMSRLDLVDKYMRPAQFANPHNVKLAHWQGYRVNLLSEPGKRDAVNWLRSRSVRVWTIDSWTALCRMSGVDPNDNKEVADLYATVVEIKIEVGIQAVFILAHTARSSSESEKPGTKGASSLDEMVDTRWMFTVDKSDVRWLQAEGRGTQMSAISLDFDEDTGRSTVGSVSRQSAAQDGMVQLIARTLKDHPEGLSQATLVKMVKEVNRKGVSAIKDGIREAEETGFIEIKDVQGGRGRPVKVHFLAGLEKPMGDKRMNATPRSVNLAGVHVRSRRRE